MEIKRENNTFIRQDLRKVDRSIKTNYQFKDLDGKEYNIYISNRKTAYIIKQSKNGREYKVTLPKEVTQAILEELRSNKERIAEQEGGII